MLSSFHADQSSKSQPGPDESGLCPFFLTREHGDGSTHSAFCTCRQDRPTGALRPMSGWLPLQLPRPWAWLPCRGHLTLQADLIIFRPNLAPVLLKIELHRPSVYAAVRASSQPRPIIHRHCRHSSGRPSRPGNCSAALPPVWSLLHQRSGLDYICLKHLQPPVGPAARVLCL